MSALAHRSPLKYQRTLPSTPEPHLRLVWSKPQVERKPEAVYRRRRIFAFVAAVAVVIGAWTAMQSGFSWIAGQSQSGTPVTAVSMTNASQPTWTVAKGDTLWSIATATKPAGTDVRPVVDKMTKARAGKPLQIGEVVTVP